MAITVAQFVERLAQSGLMSAAEVSTFQDSLPPDKRPKDVQQLAQALVQHGKLTKYQAQAVYEGKTKGLVFGQYVVLDKLGAGGMGVVLKAQHRRMKRTVAIKVLSSAAMKQAGAVERFHREAEAAAKLLASQHRYRLRRRRAPGHALPGDGVRRGQRSGHRGQGTWAAADPPGGRVHLAGGAADFSTPTARASSTATSSRAICSWTTKARSRSSTWAWPSSWEPRRPWAGRNA